MANNFDTAFQKTLMYEGWLSNDKNDRGGLTKFGISKASYPNIDIANLTLAQAKAIYQRDFWNPIKCDQIKNQDIAMQLFDIAVNCGTGGAGQIVQKAINSLLPAGQAISVDGIIGEITIAKINSLDAKVLNNRIATYRARRYAQICVKNPSQVCFLEGWLVRTFGFII